MLGKLKVTDKVQREIAGRVGGRTTSTGGNVIYWPAGAGAPCRLVCVCVGGGGVNKQTATPRLPGSSSIHFGERLE